MFLCETKGDEKVNNMNYKDTWTFQVAMQNEQDQMINKLMKDPLIKKIINKEIKGGKKVRSYFETKVVKVKGEKKENSSSIEVMIDGKKYTLCKEGYLHKEKGNWINGENLDEIKFPCFCRYSNNRHGLITKTYIGEDKETIYTLHGIENQYFSLSSIKSYSKLRRLIEAFNIHILKGKIILFEEE